MANLLDEASILLTATAYDNGSMLSIKPENGDGDMTFSRNSAATRVNAQGLVEDVASNLPRINYEGFSYDANGDIIPNSGCGSWLLEPQSTNLVTYSSELNIGTSGTAPVTSNTTISPDGALNADTLGVGYLSKSISAAANTYTLSVFVKAEISSTASIYIYDGTYYSGTYDLTTGISTGVGTSMVNYGNGWWRCIITQAIASTISEIGFNSGQVYGYGFQLEQQSYATSYIPTSGAISTRLADIATNSGNASLINSEEGVLYAEISALYDDGTNRYISIDDGTTNNYIYFRYVSTSNTVLMRTVVGGATINTIQVAVADTTENHKFAFKFKSGDFAFWINGVEVGTDTSATIFPANTLNNIGMNFPSLIGGFYANTKALAVYKTALTDAQLTLLTTI